MLFHLIIKIYKNLKFMMQEAIRKERLSRRRAGIYTYPDIMYDRRRIFNKNFPGVVNLKLTRINWL